MLLKNMMDSQNLKMLLPIYKDAGVNEIILPVPYNCFLEIEETLPPPPLYPLNI